MLYEAVESSSAPCSDNMLNDKTESIPLISFWSSQCSGGLSSFNRGKLTRLQQPTLLGTTAEIDDDNLLTSSSPLHTSTTIHTGTHIIETRTNHRHICLPQQLLVKIVTQRSIWRKRRCQYVTNTLKIGKPFTDINGKLFKLLTLFVIYVRK